MSASQLTPKRILLVDSHEDTCEMLNFFLIEYEVNPACTAVVKLRLTPHDRFDPILLDQRLANDCGTERRGDDHL